MTAMASEITGVSTACLAVSSGADKKHQSSASLASVRGSHKWPVNSPHKGPVTRKMFPFDDLIMILIVVWAWLCYGTRRWFRIERQVLSSGKNRIRTWNLRYHSPSDWTPAHKPTELSWTKLKTLSQQPVPMTGEHSAHLMPLPEWNHPSSGDIHICCLILNVLAAYGNYIQLVDHNKSRDCALLYFVVHWPMFPISFNWQWQQSNLAAQG